MCPFLLNETLPMPWWIRIYFDLFNLNIKVFILKIKVSEGEVANYQKEEIKSSTKKKKPSIFKSKFLTYFYRDRKLRNVLCRWKGV